MFWFEPPSQMLSWEYNVPNVLSNETIDSIHEYVSNNQSLLQSAEVRNIEEDDKNIDDGYRRSSVLFLTDINYFSNLYNTVINTALEVNTAHFKYALNYVEPLQYSVYNSSNLGHYDVHTDSYLRNTSGFIRKVSFSILLDDPEEFEGGDLLLHTTSEPFKVNMKKGDMFLFPSFMPHSVSPVTQGVRRSLVGWVCGPNFV